MDEAALTVSGQRRLMGTLPRLTAEHYRGRAVVFWTHTEERCATGWLDEPFHLQFREWLLHAQHRERLAAPVYVLMPDHAHIVWMGLVERSDQRMATRMLRAAWQAEWRRRGVYRLQRQAHDRVLHEEQRKHGAFRRACEYVLQNPVRAGLVGDWREYPYLGAVVPGYPGVEVRADDYWERFWRIYAAEVERKEGAAR